LSDPYTISFSLHPIEYNTYSGLCRAKSTGLRDQTVTLVHKWLEEETKKAIPKQRIALRGNAFRIMFEKWPENGFTMRQVSELLGCTPMTVRYTLQCLIRDMLVEETAPIISGGRASRAFKLTTEGLLWAAEEREKLSFIPRRDPSTGEARAAAKLYLMNAGKTGAEAEKILEQEEELCHIQDVPPNYTIENMARYLEPVTL